MAHAGTVPRPAGAAASGHAGLAARESTREAGWLSAWWPLALLIVLAAALRFSTLSLQSLWFDEAFTPVHVFSGSLATTLNHVAHTENTPPLWYVLEWAVIQVVGDGVIALRLLSALAGVAMVPVMWAIGNELAGRRAAIIAAALTATNPLFLWYSQEARAYGLYAFFCALAMWCFLRAEREPRPRTFAAFAASSALALLSHYFAIFLVAPMALWLLRRRQQRALAAGAVLAIAIVGGALIPLVLAQGGHGAQWIGQWALASRLEAIPQYYLTGYTGAALGHSVELLVALPLLAGVVFGLWRVLDDTENPRRGDRASAERVRHRPAAAARRLRRRLPRAAEPHRRDGAADGTTRGRDRGAPDRRGGTRARRARIACVPRGLHRHRSAPAPSTRGLA